MEPQQPTIIIRQLTADDNLAALTDLLHIAYATLADRGLRFLASHQTPSETRRRIAGNDCFLACVGDEMVGTVTLRPGGSGGGCSWYARSEVATICQLAVLPMWRGRGIGSQLLAHAEFWASQRNSTELALDTAAAAAGLISWYSSRGYRLVASVRFPNVNYESVVLSKTLSPDNGASITAAG